MGAPSGRNYWIVFTIYTVNSAFLLSHFLQPGQFQLPNILYVFLVIFSVASISKYLPGKIVVTPNTTSVNINNKSVFHKPNGFSTFIVASFFFCFGTYFKFWNYNYAYNHYYQIFHAINLLTICFSIYLFLGNINSKNSKPKATPPPKSNNIPTPSKSNNNNNNNNNNINNINNGERGGKEEEGEKGILEKYLMGTNYAQIFGVPISGLVMNRISKICLFYLLLSIALQQYHQLVEVERYPAQPLYFGTPLLIFLILSAVQLFDNLLNEHHEITSPTFGNRSYGWFTFWTEWYVYPFFHSCAIFPLISSPYDTLSPLLLLLIMLMFIIGLMISRTAKRQRFEYVTLGSKAVIWGDRPHIIEPKNINSTRKAILVSGWWGIIRHPTLLGDLLMYCSLSSLLFVDLSYYSFLYISLVLLMISFEVFWEERQSASKFEEVWKGYSTYVPYRLIPYLI